LPLFFSECFSTSYVYVISHASSNDVTGYLRAASERERERSE
jgi:hypothetical protein